MKKARQDFGAPGERLPRQRISRLAFLLASLLIAVTAASLLFVGYIASKASVQQSIAHEERLFRNTLADHQRSIVRGLVKIAVSDQSVAMLVRSFDPVYARKSFKTLWSDFSQSKVMVISADSRVLAESFEDYTHIVSRPLTETPQLQVIVENVRRQFLQNRVRIPGGYGHRSLKSLDLGDYAAMGFVTIDGQPAIYGAMPVIPDDHAMPLSDGMPTVLLSATYINDAQIRQLNDRLNFSSLSFVSGADVPASGPVYPVTDTGGEVVGAFVWDWQELDNSIWPTVIPVVAVLSIVLAALALGIAWRIGQLTVSLQASEQQNRYLALHDSLSGLGNRLQFNREIEAAVERLKERPAAVIHCDLDKFKEVNDSLGHAAGDEVLKVTARRLQKVIGDLGVVCRIGGDEFMVVYHGPVTKTYMKVLCKTLLDIVMQPIPLGNARSASIGLSIGVVTAPKDGTSVETLIAASDTALYHAKRAGRGRFAFYSDIKAKETAAAPDKRLEAGTGNGHETTPSGARPAGRRSAAG